jgi:hypothetical protein
MGEEMHRLAVTTPPSGVAHRAWRQCLEGRLDRRADPVPSSAVEEWPRGVRKKQTRPRDTPNVERFDCFEAVGEVQQLRNRAVYLLACEHDVADAEWMCLREVDESPQAECELGSERWFEQPACSEGELRVRVGSHAAGELAVQPIRVQPGGDAVACSNAPDQDVYSIRPLLGQQYHAGCLHAMLPSFGDGPLPCRSRVPVQRSTA